MKERKSRERTKERRDEGGSEERTGVLIKGKGGRCERRREILERRKERREQTREGEIRERRRERRERTREGER